jgi:hypothetical protein
MARSLTPATPDYLSVAAAPVTAAAMTVNARINVASLADQGIVSLSSSADKINYFLLYLEATGDDIMWARRSTTGGFTSARGSEVVSTNTWTMATGRSVSATDTSAFKDGGNKGDNTANRVPLNVDQLTLGAFGGSSFDTLLNGRIAEVAIWNAALTDAEIASLYGGPGIAIPAWSVQPSALVFYAPLFDSDGDIDWAGDGTYDLTVTGTPSYAERPPTIMWMPNWHLQRQGGAGGVTVDAGDADTLSDTVPPTVVKGSIAIAPTDSDTLSDVVDPTVAGGSVIVAAGFADTLSDVIDPSLFFGSFSVDAGNADTLSDTVQPTVVLGSFSVDAGDADTLSDVLDPTPVIGSLSVDAGNADTLSDVLDPTITGGGIVVTAGNADTLSDVIDPALFFGDVTAIGGFSDTLSDVVEPSVIQISGDGGATFISPIRYVVRT